MDKIDNAISKARQLGTARTVTPSPIGRRDWEAAVGSRISRRTRPYKIQRGTLFVRTASAAWANELSLLTETILEQLQRRGHAITALRFRVGAVDVAEPRGRKHQAPPPEPPPLPLPADVDANIEQIDNDPLKAAIRQAASKSLARHEQDKNRR